MKIKNWEDFILESVLITSNEFKNYLFEIGDNVSSKLIGLIDRDIKTDYNFLDLSDEKNKISFVSDSQAQRKISQGVDLKSIFNKNNKTTIGRIIKGILADNNIKATDKEVEDFVNKFKAKWEYKNMQEDSIKIVSGEDIRFWYLEDNYCSDTVNLGRGSLGKSCMRYEDCQEYFDIYVNNPEQVKMVIFLDGEDKLRARALLWETSDGPYLDRVYYTLDSEETLLRDWTTKYLGKEINKIDARKSFVKLNSGGEYSAYPYMDSFVYYRPQEGLLTMFVPDKEETKGPIYLLQETDGNYENTNQVYSEYHDEYYDRDEVIYSDIQDSYILKEFAIWSDYHNSHIVDSAVAYSDKFGPLYSNSSFEVFLSKDKKESDYYPKELLNSEFESYLNGRELEYYLSGVTPDLTSFYDIIKEYLDREFYNKAVVNKTYVNILDKSGTKAFKIIKDSNTIHSKIAGYVWQKSYHELSSKIRSNIQFDEFKTFALKYLREKTNLDIKSIQYTYAL
jgi:hypothetical protein